MDTKRHGRSSGMTINDIKLSLLAVRLQVSNFHLDCVYRQSINHKSWQNDPKPDKQHHHPFHQRKGSVVLSTCEREPNR